MDVLVCSEDEVLPGWNSEYPGFFVPVHGNDGVNTTTDVPGFSVSLQSLVLDCEAQQRVTKEYDLILLEDDGHDRWHLLISGDSLGAQEHKIK